MTEAIIEAIKENPVIALLLIVASVVAAVWKIFVALYVKPRDFRITTLEKHVEQLRSELIRKPVEVAISTKKESEVIPAAKQIQPTEKKLSEVIDTDPLRSLTELHRQWKDENKTDLQRKHFEETYLGKTVMWEAYIESIDKSKYWISIGASATRNAIKDVRVLVHLPLSSEPEILSYKKGDLIQITGPIKEFFLFPQIDAVNIEKIQRA